MGLEKSLPQDWVIKRLIDIAEDNKNAIVDGPFGSNLKVSDYIEGTDGVPVLTTKNLEGIYTNDSLRFISFKKFEELRRSEVRAGDILVAKIGSCGKTGIYPDYMPSAIIPANLLKISVSPEVNKFFVYYYLNSPQFRNLLSGITTATAQPAFAVTKFRTLPIPLPNRTLQEKTVEKIEELFSQLDAGVAGLKRVQELLKQYRASVLKAAFEGRLVRQDQNDEPAEGLLQKLGKRSIPVGKLKELPKGWIWTRLNEICEIILGQSPPSNTYNTIGDGLPFYQGKSEFSELYPTPQKWCSAPKKTSEKGDVLISVRAPVGPTNLCNEKSCIGRGLAAIRPLKPIPEKYILYYLRHIESEWEKVSTGTTFKAITGNVLKRKEIPLAPYLEQKRIVTLIDEQYSVINMLERIIDNEIKRGIRLHQAILNKAFEGRLIQEEPIPNQKFDLRNNENE